MVSAAILAGGRARRYHGRDKSALVVGGRRILDWQMDALAPLSRDILLVGAHQGTAPAGARVVPDLSPDHGPLGGLEAALAAAKGDRLVVVACDMPFLSTALLAHLADLAVEVDAVIPRTDRGYHPLCAVYTRACLAAVARRVAAGHLRMTELVDDLSVRAIDADALAAFGDHRRLLANINTPADYREIAARHSYGSPS